jgi:hypothetical protein
MPLFSLLKTHKSPKWTEVVKKGRSKSRSKLNTNSFNEGRVLEY